MLRKSVVSAVGQEVVRNEEVKRVWSAPSLTEMTVEDLTQSSSNGTSTDAFNDYS